MLLASGYIAGGTIAGVLGAMLAFAPDSFNAAIDLRKWLPADWQTANWPAVTAFARLALVLLVVGLGKLLGAPVAPTPQRSGESGPASK